MAPCLPRKAVDKPGDREMGRLLYLGLLHVKRTLLLVKAWQGLTGRWQEGI